MPTASLLLIVTAEVQGSGNGTVPSSAISCPQGPAWLWVSWRGHWVVPAPQQVLLPARQGTSASPNSSAAPGSE